MSSNTTKTLKRERRHRKIRARISGTKDVPRLSVFKSNRYVYVQLIDDLDGKTLAFASSLGSKKRLMAAAKEIGQEIAKKAKVAKISKVVFDRGGYRYMGIVAALADSAREGGLVF